MIGNAFFGKTASRCVCQMKLRETVEAKEVPQDLQTQHSLPEMTTAQHDSRHHMRRMDSTQEGQPDMPNFGEQRPAQSQVAETNPRMFAQGVDSLQ